MGLDLVHNIALLVALANADTALETGAGNVIQVSWVCIWILAYPALVPSAPHKTLIASLAAAIMDPLVIQVMVLIQHGTWAPPIIWLFFMSSYICAFLAVLPAKIVIGLRHKVERARELGSYRLVERIGKGGMGEVWRAQHHLLARPAAVKIIRTDSLGTSDSSTTRSALRRFEREAQATALLRSPHTVQVFDFGLGRDDTFYYVMELLDGLDLQTLVRRFGPLPAARVRHILMHACHSLLDAHSAGLIHQDVKPANLFVCRMGQDCDFVKVLDFGLVKASGSALGLDSIATGGVVAAGTPAFMAPEQIMGDGAADHRLDIYALGCVAYWLLTGELIFDAGSEMEMLLQHVQKEPVPPSQRTELPVPTELETIVLRCLAKDPADRPQDAGELARVLAACDLPDAWGDEQARGWWDLHLPGGGEGTGEGVGEGGSEGRRGGEDAA